MARQRSHKSKSKKADGADGADKFGHGEVDEFFAGRDKVSLDSRPHEDDEDYLTGQSEAVFDLGLKDQNGADDYHDAEDEEDAPAPTVKSRKAKKLPTLQRGRFAKTSSDESSASGSDDDSADDADAEGWGRSYYSRPSARREREERMISGEDAERRDEERRLELAEVKRLQRKMREGIRGEEDWGLDAVRDGEVESESQLETAPKPAPTPAPAAPPATADPTALLDHMAAHDPVKLALTRELPLVAHRLEKTERGIRRMQKEAEKGEPIAPPGFAWMHYHTLLTYATTLAFYIHLAALPAEARPDLASHPILPRLLQLKEGLNLLEGLDLAAASDDEGDTIELFDREANAASDDDEEDVEDGEGGPKLSKAAEKAILAKLMQTGELDLVEGEYDEEADAQGLWTGELDEGELEDLRRDAEMELAGGDEGSEEEDEDDEGDSGSDLSLDDVDLDVIASGLKSVKSDKKPAVNGKPAPPAPQAQAYTLLEEPEFVPSKPSSSKLESRSSAASNEDMGDPTHLSTADSADKAAKKRSLRFHTSKIAATSARRNAARQERMGGDDDLPYRDRKAARDAALRKNGGEHAEGEDLDGKELTERDRKRAREVMESDLGGIEQAEEGDDGYYELVKRRKTEEKQAKKDDYDAEVAARKAELEVEDEHSGPRSLTRAIEKNRGLTPHRSKSVRNPRVKKRERYEKAKRKLSSQRAVYKGGQGALGGAYQGEKSGISTTVKSRHF